MGCFSYGGNMGETFKNTDTIETEWLNEVETKLQQATEIINEVRSLVSEKIAGKIKVEAILRLNQNSESIIDHLTNQIQEVLSELAEEYRS